MLLIVDRGPPSISKTSVEKISQAKKIIKKDIWLKLDDLHQDILNFLKFYYISALFYLEDNKTKIITKKFHKNLEEIHSKMYLEIEKKK